MIGIEQCYIKLYHSLNDDFFNGELKVPNIFIIPASKPYLCYRRSDDGIRLNISIANGRLWSIQELTTKMIHEMTHFYNDSILNIQDTSRGGAYHNKYFARQAEQRGLIVTYSDKYGYAHTEASDKLLEWISAHDDLTKGICKKTPEISVSYMSPAKIHNAGNRNGYQNGHHRKYMCPCCGNSCRATKKINIICGDCGVPMSVTVIKRDDNASHYTNDNKNKILIPKDLPEEMLLEDFMAYIT